tara:strand:- start:787 stop:1062 length:276 start_codon:yes stop_codon:yes gene_type:complete
MKTKRKETAFQRKLRLLQRAVNELNNKNNIMGLQEIKDDLENERDTILDRVIEFFEDSDKEMTVSNIQRYHKVGYARAHRIIRQIQKERVS